MTIDDLAEKLKNPPTTFWKWFGGVVAFIVIIAIGLALSKKAKELADAKTALAAERLKAQQQEMAAKMETDAVKRAELEKAAADARARVTAEARALDAVEAQQKLAEKKLSAVSNKDWATLNELAGVPPETPKT